MKENGEMKFKGFCEVCENPQKNVFYCSNACDWVKCEDIPSEFVASEPPVDDWPDIEDVVNVDFEYGSSRQDMQRFGD